MQASTARACKLLKLEGWLQFSQLYKILSGAIADMGAKRWMRSLWLFGTFLPIDLILLLDIAFDMSCAKTLFGVSVFGTV